MNAVRLKLHHSAIPFDGARDDGASDAFETASDARDEAHSFEQHEEVREPAPTVDKKGTPSTQETEEQPVHEPQFSERRCFEPAEPSDD